jgi:branched-chain amino acid aminotransferase
MYDIIGDYFFENGREKKVQDFQLEIESNHIIYEVVRVINQEILFLEDHMSRLKGSLDYVHENVLLVEKITKDLKTLVNHHTLNQNIKIDVYDGHYRLYFIKSNYPKKELYSDGVEVCILDHHRKDPEIKALDMDYKRRIETIKGNQYFEVLLRDEDGYVLEGSRSNVVFIKDHQIISAPLHEILNGVTFKNVVKMAEELDIDVVYRKVHFDELKSMEACFITGTSLGVLPVKSILDSQLDPKHKVIQALINSYNKVY